MQGRYICPSPSRVLFGLLVCCKAGRYLHRCSSRRCVCSRYVDVTQIVLKSPAKRTGRNRRQTRPTRPNASDDNAPGARAGRHRGELARCRNRASSALDRCSRRSRRILSDIFSLTLIIPALALDCSVEDGRGSGRTQPGQRLAAKTGTVKQTKHLELLLAGRLEWPAQYICRPCRPPSPLPLPLLLAAPAGPPR